MAPLEQTIVQRLQCPKPDEIHILDHLVEDRFASRGCSRSCVDRYFCGRLTPRLLARKTEGSIRSFSPVPRPGVAPVQAGFLKVGRTELCEVNGFGRRDVWRGVRIRSWGSPAICLEGIAHDRLSSRRKLQFPYPMALDELAEGYVFGCVVWTTCKAPVCTMRQVGYIIGFKQYLDGRAPKRGEAHCRTNS